MIGTVFLTENLIHLAKIPFNLLSLIKTLLFQEENRKFIEFKCLNNVQPIQGDSLLLTTKSLGIPGTLLIDLTMKAPSDFEPANPGLVIGKQFIISLCWKLNTLARLLKSILEELSCK